MPEFEWTRQNVVDVPDVDEEHQALFRLCADLQNAVKAGAPAAQVHSILDDLIAHTAEHFSHEERQMRTTGYSHYAWHQRQHHTARSKVTAFERRVRRGDLDAAREMLDFLHGWLKEHIGIADRMLAAHLRNHQRQLQVRRAS